MRHILPLTKLIEGDPTDTSIDAAFEYHIEGINVYVGPKESQCKVMVEHNDGKVSILIIGNEGRSFACVDVDLSKADDNTPEGRAEIRYSRSLCDVEEVSYV